MHCRDPDGKEAQEGGVIRTRVADSLCSTVKTT